MIAQLAAVLIGRLRREGGQVLPVTAAALVALIGFTGLVVDIGRVWIAQRQLQNAVDAAVLVAGQDMPNSQTAYTDAVAFSGLNSGGTIGKNALGGYGVSSTQPQLNITFKCLSVPSGLGSCDADTSSSNYNWHPPGAQTPQCQLQGATNLLCNAVTVSETATVSTTFAKLFLPSFTVSASATGAAQGGGPPPLNVEVILDTTNSMGGNNHCTSPVSGINDQGGTPDKLDCAKAGVRALLEGLWPCDQGATCGPATSNLGALGANVANPVDEVGMLVFPAISGNPPTNATLQKELDCNSSSSFTDTYPQYFSYAYPNPIPTADQYLGYQVVGLSSDYRADANEGTGLSGSSNLVESVYWAQCPGPPGSWSGDSNGSMASGTRYYNVNASASGSTTTTANTITLSQAETITGLTFDTSGSGSGFSYTATVGIPGSGTTWTSTGLACTSSGGAQCTASGSVTEPAGTKLNLRVVSGSGSGTRSGTWTVNYTGPGGQYPGGDYYGIKDIGGQGSYLAGAITEAQNLLGHAAASRSGTSNVIIVLSDGELNAPKGWTDNTPCQRAIDAATQAKKAGTTIYSIAYDSSSSASDCADSGSLTPLQTMQQIASDPTKTFFNQPNPGDLTAVFASIAGKLTQGRPRLTG